MMETITQAVGIRNGTTIAPNNQTDLQTVTGLLDRISLTNGGTAATPGLWSNDRTELITQVAVAITAFQTANQLTIDGVVDPGGRTIRMMNQVALPEPVSATVIRQEENSQRWVVAEPSSLPGTGLLQPLDISPQITRALVRVKGTSIEWFGVVVPRTDDNSILGGPPHIFFTPSPNQGNFQDNTYHEFSAWIELWNKYTSAIGSQLVFSGVSQILVIPFYKNSQAGNLGSFLTNWQEVISLVITAAIDSIDPLFLRDRFEFDRIFSSSFSNGIVTLQNFNTAGAGTDAVTERLFDLDGQASGSQWRSSKGIIYRNKIAPNGTNPIGSDWFVGGRFAQLRPFYPPNDHNICPFLLLHGLSNFG
jgi:hypothetical protein